MLADHSRSAALGACASKVLPLAREPPRFSPNCAQSNKTPRTAAEHYCSLIRIGKRVPHARHWAALRRVALPACRKPAGLRTRGALAECCTEAFLRRMGRRSLPESVKLNRAAQERSGRGRYYGCGSNSRTSSSLRGCLD